MMSLPAPVMIEAPSGPLWRRAVDGQGCRLMMRMLAWRLCCPCSRACTTRSRYDWKIRFLARIRLDHCLHPASVD